MEQTAVEWLFSKMNVLNAITDTPISVNGRPHEWNELYEQAKQMEKKQIIDAVDDWVFNGTKKGEQYYNENYGDKNGE